MTWKTPRKAPRQRRGLRRGGRRAPLPRRRSHASGVVAVELALLLPLLVLVLTGLFDLGLAAYEAMLVQAAAAAGARYAELHPWDPSAVAAVVAASTESGGITANPPPTQFCACPATGSLGAIDCSGTCPGGSRPSLYGKVSAQLAHFTVLHYPALPQPFTLTGQAIVRLR